MSEPKDGDIRINNNQFERYDAFVQNWVLPDDWFTAKTGSSPINNFASGHLWDCYYNMYTTDCWSSMNRVFNLGEAGEQLLQDYYMQTSTIDLVIYLLFG